MRWIPLSYHSGILTSSVLALVIVGDIRYRYVPHSYVEPDVSMESGVEERSEYRRRLWTNEEEEHLEAIRIAHKLDDMGISSTGNDRLFCRCPCKPREHGIPAWLDDPASPPCA